MKNYFQKTRILKKNKKNERIFIAKSNNDILLEEDLEALIKQINKIIIEYDYNEMKNLFKQYIPDSNVIFFGNYIKAELFNIIYLKERDDNCIFFDKIPENTYVSPISKELYIKGDRNEAVLLLHGYTGSPHDMYYLGKELNKGGFTVYIPRLPGHGTNSQDF